MNKADSEIVNTAFRGRLVRRVRFVLFFLVVLATTVSVTSVSTLISLLTLWRRPPFSLCFLWERAFNFACRWLLGIRFCIRGIENIPQGARVLFACKHQSLWETIALLTPLRVDAYIGKRSLSFIPLWGWALYFAGKYVPVNRAAVVASTFALLRRLRKRLAEPRFRRVMIFPEGKRTLPAETSPAYREGVELLYRHFSFCVVPIAVNSGHLWPKKGYRRAGTITVSILEPIAPGLAKGKLVALLQDRIEAEVRRIGIP